MWWWAGITCGRRIQKMEDVQCSAIPIRSWQHMPPPARWNLAPTLHAPTLHSSVHCNLSPQRPRRACEMHWTILRRILQKFQHHTNTTPRSQLSLRKPNMHHSNALSLLLDFHKNFNARADFPSVSSLPRPTRSRVVPSSRLVCTYIYKATECELAPLMSQISNVHPATLS
jgi:hypothetical protein